MREPVLDYKGQHFEFHDVPMTIKPHQLPYPPMWYPSFSPDGTTFAARHGFNFMSLGPPSLTTDLMQLYRETWRAHQTDEGRLNGHVAEPKLGAMRQIFIAETDQQAIDIARPAYETWYQSITELWHRNDDHSYDSFFAWDACLESETILIGSAETVREKLQTVITQSGINYVVGSFAWGSLTAAQSQDSFGRFVDDVATSLVPAA